MEKTIRLDKMLSNEGIATRSEIKKIIKAGKVLVNGAVVKSGDIKISSNDIIICQGKEIRYTKYLYYVLNKPAGCVTAKTDQLNDTVFKYIHENRKDLSPVGRLDKDTEGLLIFTNDGELNHLLMSPAHHVKKVYEAVIDSPIDESAICLFANGVDIGDEELTRPAKLSILQNDMDKCLIQLEISEGRYHQVKRMFESIGHKVVYLKRIAIGNIELTEDLKIGTYRKLTDDEVEGLRACVK